MNFIPKSTKLFLLFQIVLPVFCLMAENDVGRELLEAAKKKDSSCFVCLLNKAQLGYKGAKQFFDVLNVRDEDSYNLLLFFALIGDIENLSLLLDGLKKYYGTNTQELFEYLNTKNDLGLNALGLAIFNGNRRLIELLLVRSFDLIGADKDLFFKFINNHDSHGLTPLISASMDSQSDNVIMMIKLAAKTFGRDSTLFDSFINAEDKEGNTALAMAFSDPDKFFLMGYGAHEGKQKNEDNTRLVRAFELGKNLINAARHENLDQFQSIILQAAEEFKNDQDALYHFFSTTDESGWNVLIHTSVEGHYDFVKVILDAIEKYFLDNEKELKSFLVSHSDFEGRTALHMAIMRRHYKVANLLFDSILKYIKDKPLLFAFLNSPEELSGHTPFISIVYGSEDYDKPVFDFLKKMITNVERIFGKSSRIFELFINAHDYNGMTALAYASDDAIKDLLISFGARDIPMKHFEGIGSFEKLEMQGDV